jgi:thymidine phosphorylase
MVEAEGGDPFYINSEKIDLLCRVKRKVAVYPEYEGYICGMNAEGIGTAAQMIGAGREKKEDTIDHAVGLIMHKRLGDAVSMNEPICTFYVNDETRLDDAVALLKKSVSISGEQPVRTPMVYEVIS